MIRSRQQGRLRVWMMVFCLIREVHSSLPAPQNVAIVSFNMEHKLTWRPGPGTAAATHFRVQSCDLKTKTWISVKNCSDLQIGESCDLTKYFKEIYGLYQARVQAFIQDQESDWTRSRLFTPLMDTTLGPPAVSLTGCGNCLLLKLSLPHRVEENLSPVKYFYQAYTVNVTRTRDKAQFTVKASNGENLINYLEPGVEYCITVTAVSFRKPMPPSDPQCAYTSPQKLNTVVVFLSALCSVFLLVLFLCAALIYTGQLHNRHTLVPRALLSFIWKCRVSGGLEPDPEKVGCE
ncbi:interferon alpha/beta receptor 2 isoform X1 [Clarias magur]|uniref:Interferon alpha/beta receptor 2 isoform X1 n=1 Tax=Clarias magur TaxID=1594786 RepID=A0A8J4X3I2_CLAMG|nr:interferon alpha/beta receptor 2 isoform X1 [Clarias magur]